MAHRSITQRGETVELKSVADLVCDLVHPEGIATNSNPLATAKPSSVLAISPNSRNSSGEPLANDATAIAQRAIALAALTDDQKQQRLADLRRDPGIARFWSLVWPDSQTPPKDNQ